MKWNECKNGNEEDERRWKKFNYWIKTAFINDKWRSFFIFLFLQLLFALFEGWWRFIWFKVQGWKLLNIVYNGNDEQTWHFLYQFALVAHPLCFEVQFKINNVAGRKLLDICIRFFRTAYSILLPFLNSKAVNILEMCSEKTVFSNLETVCSQIWKSRYFLFTFGELFRR